MLSDADMLERMDRGWRGGRNDGTVCGQGSTIHNTWRISEWLPKVIRQYHIQSICDAGAGDLHWADSVDWPCSYYPYDLIPRAKGINKRDITTEKMRDSDAILCRMVLNHLMDGADVERIEMALKLFEETSKYLIATHFVGDQHRDAGFTNLDLTQWLGEPLEMCQDGHEDGCRLALWKLNEGRE